MRLPGDISDDVDEDPTGNKAIWDRGLMSGAAQKVWPYGFVLDELMLMNSTG